MKNEAGLSMTRWLTRAGVIVCGFLAFGVIAILPLGCKPAPKHTGPLEKITLAYSTAPNALLVQLALAKGFFAEEGLDVTPHSHAFGKLALAEVVAGKADIATVGDTPIVFAVMNGEKITTLATIQTSNKSEAVVARRDRGITKPADLNGKNIGVTLGTTADFFVDTLLLAHGVTRKQVTLIDMRPDEMAAALDQGTVDAVSAFDPTVQQLEKRLGEHGIVFFDESLYTETFCVAGTQEYVQKNPDAVKKFLRAIIKAETFAQQHNAEARVRVAAFINLDKTLLDEVWNIVTLRVTLDQALLVDFEDQSRWVLKNRLSTGTKMPNYLDYIYINGLKAVKPEAVTIVH